MIKDHTDSERGNLQPPLLQRYFYMHHPTDSITHTTAFVTPVVEHWLKQAMGPSYRIDPTTHRTTATSRSGGPIELFLILASAP